MVNDKSTTDLNHSPVPPSGYWEGLGLTETRYYYYKFMYAMFWRTLCPCPDGRFLKVRNWLYNLTGKLAFHYHKKLCQKCASRSKRKGNWAGPN